MGSDRVANAPVRSNDGRSRLLWAVFFCLLTAYTLSGSRERPWGDAQHTYEVAHSIVTRGALDIRYDWPPQTLRGRDGKIYSISGLLQSLLNIPGVLLVQLAFFLAPSSRGFVLPLASHLAFAICGALTCLMFFRLSRRLGASAAIASVATLMLAFGTMTWVYARYPYADIVQTMCCLGFFGAMWRLIEERSDSAARWAGLWAGLLINTKLVYLLGLAGAGAYAVWVMRHDGRRLGRLFAWSLATLAPLVFLLLSYNYLRWGSPFHSGYEGQLGNALEESWVTGLWGLLFSPGKSIFAFNPPLVAAVLVLPAFVRRHGRLAALMAALVLPVVGFYGIMLWWPGGYCWGPRYLGFVVPLLLLPLPGLLSSLRPGLRLRRWIVAGLVLLSIGGVTVQLLGNAFYWDHYIRISMEARERWLGDPNRSGAFRPEKGRGHCDDCFEDMYPSLFLPSFQPIAGHAWLLRHALAKHDWEEAERDAPWRRYTNLKLNIARTYRRARLDWWVLLWTDDYPQYRTAGMTILVILLVCQLWTALLWLRWIRLMRGDR